MLDDKFVVLVVDGDDAQAFHDTLTKQQWSFLTLHHRGVNIVKNCIANLHFAERNCCSFTDLSVRNLIVLLALDILLGQIAVLEHEVGFYGGNCHV